MLSALLGAMALSTSCARVVSDPVLPPLQPYSPDVQALAADELESLGLPCPPDIVIPGCSAVARLVIDYGTLRDRIRAGQ